MYMGCSPDPVDAKDFMLSSFVDYGKPLPEDHNYIVFSTGVGDQGCVPSCVGWGCTAIKEILDFKNSEFTKLSPIWLYDQCKRIDDDPYGEGTHIRAAMKVLAKSGHAPYNLVPSLNNYYFGILRELNIAEEFTRPYRIKTYARLINIDDMCRCIAQHGPFAMGIKVTDQFENAPKEGFIPLHYKRISGGHCIAIIGYDNKDQTFLVQNSWGTGWGNYGFAKMPYEYWERYGMDAWGIVDISPNEI